MLTIPIHSDPPQYDSSGALFYLDPPYWGSEKSYGQNMFERAEFSRMAEQLATISGRFILSINDVPEIRNTFSRFNLLPVETTYSVGTSTLSRGKKAELLISNFWLDR